jgi:hypothetical protein
MGVAYSIIGIFIALIVFPQDPALIAVGITTILFLPSLQGIMGSVERGKDGTRLMDAVRMGLPVVNVYFLAFAGIFLSFAFFSMAMPQLAANHVFKQQLGVLAGTSGQAVAFSGAQFMEILVNNSIIMLLCFVISLIAGNGAMLFVAWNASVWGTIFGMVARSAASAIGGSSWVVFIIILTAVTPHMVLEALSYITAAVSGTMISEHLVNAPRHTLRHTYWLIGVAIVFLLLGALVETFVINNVAVYGVIRSLG